jgi:hypothetical protein
MHPFSYALLRSLSYELLIKYRLNGCIAMFGDLSVENKPEGVGKTIKFEIGP